MLDVAQFRYADGPDPHWWTRVRDGSLDLVLPGEASGPDRQRLLIARTVLPCLDELERRAQQYLDAYLRTDTEADPDDAWESLWLEFGASRREPLDRFTLYLNRPVSDAHGLFHVTFRLHYAQPGRSYPIAFGRRDW